MINTNRGTPNADATRLHRATCRTISRPDTVYTGGSYIKVCSSERDVLVAWTRGNFTFFVEGCRLCSA